jgi:hypothetical protein
MRRHEKPVRRCYACPLNLGDHCWLYLYPRGQWRGGRNCPSFSDPETHRQCMAWGRRPTVKTRKELRREAFRRNPPTATKRISLSRARGRLASAGH